MDNKEITLNPEQENAVYADINENTIVTAAAGSGKTFVLVERVIDLICDREKEVSADTLAIMTFTKNATRSLHEKLNKALDKKLRGEKLSDDDRAYLEEQKFKLRQANISTIDAFCLRIIKENPEAFGLPVTFTIADPAKKAAMQTRAISLAMKAFYDSDNPEPEYSFTKEERSALFYTFNFEDDRALREKVISFADDLSTYVNADKWLSEAQSVYADAASLEKRYIGAFISWLDPIMCRWGAGSPPAKRKGRIQILLETYDTLISELTDEARELKSEATARKNALNASAEKKKAKDIKDAEKDIEKADKLLDDIVPELKKFAADDGARFAELEKPYAAFTADPSIRTLTEFFEKAQELPKMPALSRAGKSSEYRKSFTAAKNNMQQIYDELAKYSSILKNNDNDLQRIAVNAFVKLIRIYIQQFGMIKASGACIDFSDCELLLLNKLTSDEKYREQLSRRFSCVIVDEFQDSNDIQAEIFKQIADGRLFYVGDIKQSIYAFRGGNPKIMSALCKGTDGFKPLPLSRNYRSRNTVIDVVNKAFCGLMTEEYGGVEYDTDENRLKYGADYPDTHDSGKYGAEIYLLNDDNVSEDNKNYLQPRFVARKIKELHDDENFLIIKEVEKDGKKENALVRPDYSDFIILLRSKKRLNEYRQALAELGISSSAPKGGSFLESEEIKLILNYLEIIDNPLKDEQLLKVLMSPIYRFSANEIAEIRLGLAGIGGGALTEPQKKKLAVKMKNYSLFNCLRKCSLPLDLAEELSGETGTFDRNVSPKITRFLEELSGFRYFMNSNSLHKLVCKIYADTDAELIAAAFEDSAQRVANVRRLQDMAADFESRDGGSLGDFLRFIERVKLNQQQKVEDASRPEDKANAVRIMTFHASKGLEAPVCVMSELNGQLSMKDYTGTMLADRENYFALMNVNIKKRVKSKSFAYCALEKINRKRACGEELRLLYVAMTRAREKLIMVGKGSSENWNETVLDPAAPEDVFESSVPFKWIYSSLLRYLPSGSDKLNGVNCFINEINDFCGEAPQPTQEEKPEREISKDDVASLCEKMSFCYAYDKDTKKRGKYSVTELAHRNSTAPFNPASPSFAKDYEGVSGADRGNAYHHCMEHIRLDKFRSASPDKYADLAKTEIENLARLRKLSPKEAEIIEPDKIAEFFKGELGQRILICADVIREEEFYNDVMGKDIGEDDLDEFLLQGRVDLYFVENGEIVVVDYKTDKPYNLEKEKENYAKQVKIYSSILPKSTGMKVKEIYLYAFATGEALKIQ